MCDLMNIWNEVTRGSNHEFNLLIVELLFLNR